MCTSIGLPVFERRKSVEPPTERASPAPSSESPPPSARASISGISPNSWQRPISSAPALVGERGGRRGLVVARLRAKIALEQLVLPDQLVNVHHHRRVRRARDIAHRRAADVLRVVPAEVLERPPGEHREQEIVIVELV